MKAVHLIAGVVLAAGESMRLGRPKPFVWYQGEYLVERAVRVMAEAGLLRILLCCRRDHLSALREIRYLFNMERLGILEYVTPQRGLGLSESLKSSFAHLLPDGQQAKKSKHGIKSIQLAPRLEGYEALLLHQVDRPFVHATHLSKIMNCYLENSFQQGSRNQPLCAQCPALAIYSGSEGVLPPAVLPLALRPHIFGLSGDVGLRKLITSGTIRRCEVRIDRDADFEFDIDTPSDLRSLYEVMQSKHLAL